MEIAEHVVVGLQKDVESYRRHLEEYRGLPPEQQASSTVSLNHAYFDLAYRIGQVVVAHGGVLIEEVDGRGGRMVCKLHLGDNIICEGIPLELRDDILAPITAELRKIEEPRRTLWYRWT